MQDLIFNFLKFLLQLDQFVSAFICLLYDLMFLLHFLNLLVVLDEKTEVTMIVVDNLNLKCSFVVSIYISSEFHLNCLRIGSLIKKLFHSHHVSTWINNGVIFLHLFNN